MLHTLALLLTPLLLQAPDASLDSLWGDWNADGREDLLLLEEGRLRLFEDDPAAGLREVTVAAGLDAWSGLDSVLWEDLDGDGSADLLLARRAGDGALLSGLARGGWQAQASVAGLDLARPLTRVRRAGTSLMLEGPDGVRLARFEAGRGWREFELAASSSAARVVVTAESAAETPVRRDVEDPAGRTQAALPGTVTVGGVSSSTLLPPLNGICAGFLEDQATSTCLPASSIPILGTLYPLSVNWNVTPGGNVGIGTTTPGAKLDVLGSVRGQQLISTASAFTAPLVVTSSIKVANLNADKLDGIDSTAFSQLGNSIEGSEITLGTITADRLASPLVGNGVSGPTLYATASGLGASALRGVGTGGTSNVGVHGESTSTSGLAYGVRGISASTTGRAVSAESTATTGAATGVYASTASTSGSAIQAVASATTGLNYGIQATNAATQGTAVYGFATRLGPYAPRGVVGEVSAEGGIGVWGRSNATSQSPGMYPKGVYGETFGPGGAAVYGRGNSTSGYSDGVIGETNSPVGFGVASLGDFAATGVKSFVQPHPTDASKELRFVCLEGNESGTYFRGSAELLGGQAVIEVPEEFRLVSELEGLTVQLTPRGPGRLWVESEDLDRIVVRGDVKSFHYLVNGVRRGFRDTKVLQENRLWVPKVRGVPFGTQYPAALRQILVENGTLNADFTPNEATAAARGWVLRDPEPAGPLGAQLGTAPGAGSD